jgi:RHS repeat-associated protein
LMCLWWVFLWLLASVLICCMVLLPGYSQSVMAREVMTYVHHDAQGNTVLSTNAQGEVLWRERFHPFGQPIVQSEASKQQRQMFHGKPYDRDTGLSYFGARDYDPVVGRFMGMDPVAPDPTNIHSFNRYAYGNNNPLKYTDPDGRVSQAIAVGVLGLAALGTMMLSNKPVTPVSLPTMSGNSLDRAMLSTILHTVVWVAQQRNDSGKSVASTASTASMTLTFPTGKALTNVVKMSPMAAKPPENAYDPNGPKAPGKPTAGDGFKDPKNGENWVPNPNPGKGGGSHGWQDAKGYVWVPTGQGGRSHGGSRWDVQSPGGGYRNVRPNKK